MGETKNREEAPEVLIWIQLKRMTTPKDETSSTLTKKQKPTLFNAHTTYKPIVSEG